MTETIVIGAIMVRPIPVITIVVKSVLVRAVVFSTIVVSTIVVGATVVTTTRPIAKEEPHFVNHISGHWALSAAIVEVTKLYGRDSAAARTAPKRSIARD